MECLGSRPTWQRYAVEPKFRRARRFEASYETGEFSLAKSNRNAMILNLGILENTEVEFWYTSRWPLPVTIFRCGAWKVILMVLITNPNHSPICIGSQWDLDSLPLKPELIKSDSVRSMRLAALTEMISLAPEMPSSMYTKEKWPMARQRRTKGLNIFVKK